MADFGASTDPLQRYSAIEKAYTENRWGAVIEQGDVLLNDLPWIPGGCPAGLKERIQLLVAHAHLYGFSQKEQAQRLYQEVVNAGGEPSLIQIAQQGLDQCATLPAGPAAADAVQQTEASAPEPQEPAPQATAASAPFSASIASAVEAPGPSAGEPLIAATGSQPASSGTSMPAMPWLSAAEQAALQVPEPGPAGNTNPATAASVVADAAPRVEAVSSQEPLSLDEPLIPEVIEEPELIEVHQADPLRAEELVVPVRESLAAAESRQEAVAAAAATTTPETESPSVLSGMATELGATDAEPVAFESLPEEEPTPSAARGLGVFRNPPKPVARENPELLKGLLRVQLG